MLGGYNISPLIELLDHPVLGAIAAKGLTNTLLVFDAFHDVKEKADKGNKNAESVLQSRADAEWFTSRPEVPGSLTVTVVTVTGGTTPQAQSPAPAARRRHALPFHPPATH